MATMTTKLLLKLISCELCENICGRGVCLPCCSVQACRGCATKKRMSLTKPDENSILGQLRKIADQLGIPEQGQSEAQLALDIHLILKDPKVNDQPLKGKEVETNKRELPIHGTVEFNRKAKLLEDPSVCQCRKVFPLMSLPDTVLSRVFKSLDIKDKKSLRLVNRWFGKKVKILDTAFRTWKIDLNEHSEFKQVQDTLEKAKIDGIFLNYSINIGLLNKELCQAYKKEMLTWILNVWGVSVTGLNIFLEGNEKFLLNEFFKFPNLEMLHLDGTEEYDEVSHDRDYKIEIELIKRHANTLTKISVRGYWDWIQIPYEINLPRIQVLKFADSGYTPIKFLTLTCSKNLKRIDFECCFCINQPRNQPSIPEIKIPKLLHFSIKSSTVQLYRFAEQFAEQLITLKIEDVDVYDKRAKFRNLKYLWIDKNVKSGWKFIQDCSSTLEHLVCKFPCATYNEFAQVQKLEFDLPNLRDLYIMDVGSWRPFFHAENLEFLFITRDTTSFYDEFRLDKSNFNLKYPNLKTLLLPGCINDSLVAKLTAENPSKYCSIVKDAVVDSVLTLKQDVNRAMRLRAKEFYSCPDLVPFIHDDCPIR